MSGSNENLAPILSVILDIKYSVELYTAGRPSNIRGNLSTATTANNMNKNLSNFIFVIYFHQFLCFIIPVQLSCCINSIYIPLSQSTSIFLNLC